MQRKGIKLQKIIQITDRLLSKGARLLDRTRRSYHSFAKNSKNKKQRANKKTSKLFNYSELSDTFNGFNPHCDIGKCRKIQKLVDRLVFESTLWPIDTCEASCCKVTQGDVVTLLAAGEKKCTFHDTQRLLPSPFWSLFNTYAATGYCNYTVLDFFSVQSTFGYGKGASIKHTLLTWNAGLQLWERCYGSCHHNFQMLLPLMLSYVLVFASLGLDSKVCA